MMSSSRLCVRISNCSIDFLSTCGLRFTVYRSIRVGSGIGPATRAPVRLAVSTMSPRRLVQHAVVVTPSVGFVCAGRSCSSSPVQDALPAASRARSRNACGSMRVARPAPASANAGPSSSRTARPAARRRGRSATPSRASISRTRPRRPFTSPSTSPMYSSGRDDLELHDRLEQRRARPPAAASRSAIDGRRAESDLGGVLRVRAAAGDAHLARPISG